MSKPKIYGFCDAGCKWEVPHKSEGTSSVYLTATVSSAGGQAILVLEDEIINANSFIEVFPANVTAREYMKNCLTTAINPLVAGNTLTIFVSETDQSNTDTLKYIVKVDNLDSGSAVYVHI